jgi:hypothetical protein
LKLAEIAMWMLGWLRRLRPLAVLSLGEDSSSKRGKGEQIVHGGSRVGHSMG